MEREPGESDLARARKELDDERFTGAAGGSGEVDR